MYMQDEYISPELAHTGWQRATERLVEFSWEARSKSNCPTVRRSRVLFLLQARPRKVGRPREELIIRYEPSRGERVVSVTKNERRRESEVKETGKETAERKWKEKAEKRKKERQWAEKKEQKRALDNVVVALLDADLFYFVFLQIPRIHAVKFQLLDRSTRNAKWVTIKIGR